MAEGAAPRTTPKGAPETLAALRYVVDGRDAEALRAYAALAARFPGNEAYRALVRLLQRRGQEACAKPPVTAASCPDIKR